MMLLVRMLQRLWSLADQGAGVLKVMRRKSGALGRTGHDAAPAAAAFLQRTAVKVETEDKDAAGPHGHEHDENDRNENHTDDIGPALALVLLVYDVIHDGLVPVSTDEVVGSSLATR
eukprot:c21166_g1_i1.p2 GENE.c21166_g1_i1~~c21166_g1_i1.p2  ORF type:complete len:117 (-),score=10.73 c21166_g1_i1:201-551(-)